MLEDRDYMRQPVYERRVSYTVALLVVNAAIFLIQRISASAYFPHGQEIQDKYFALSIGGLKSGYIWQLLTFQFMHANWLHILFNSIAIFFFGRPVETFFGRSKFLTLYFSSGIIGGLVQMLFALLLPQYFNAPVVGASAGASGLVAAFAILHWEERFTLLLYFIPITMRGKTLLWASLALAMLGILTPGSNIANAAHFGGILTGFFLSRQMLRGNWPQWKFPSRRSAPREMAAKHAGKNSFWRLTADQPDDELAPDEFLQKEVDPILDKISARGIQSLTAREREILEKARSKINKP